MAEKNQIKVLIDGRTITLAGYEDEEYLLTVANYINRKISGFYEIPGYRRMTEDQRSTLLAMNVADDYFKAKNQAAALEESIEAREQDTYGLKQDLVNSQMEADRLRSENDALKKEIEKLRNKYGRKSGSGRF